MAAKKKAKSKKVAKKVAKKTKPSSLEKRPKRGTLSRNTEGTILEQSRRRCCLCFYLNGSLAEVKGQIAHLDHNALNQSIGNLAFLCLKHHNEYDSRSFQTKTFTIQEVKSARNELHNAIRKTIREPRVRHVTVQITIEGDEDELDVKELQKRLMAISEDKSFSFKVKFTRSVVLVFECSERDFHKIKRLFDEGKLAHKIGADVRSVVAIVPSKKLTGQERAKRKTAKRKTAKRKTAKRKTAKRKTAKRKTAKWTTAEIRTGKKKTAKKKIEEKTTGMKTATRMKTVTGMKTATRIKTTTKKRTGKKKTAKKNAAGRRW